MKKLIFILLFSTVMFSSPSYAKWTKVTEDENGVTYYVDFERIKKHDGNVYFWALDDYLKPDGRGYLSSRILRQVDCKLFRSKFLSITESKEPMGGGTSENHTYNDKNWTYASPNSVVEALLKAVCSQ